MQPRGGTEILTEALLRHLGVDWLTKINLLVSQTNPASIDSTRKNLLWQHLDIDQHNAQGMQVGEFVSQLDEIVYVSNWQREQFQNHFQATKGIVLHNAIEPIDYAEKPTDELTLIYTSMPYRGLEVLLDAFAQLDRPHVKLVVYSSNVIYGKNWANAADPTIDALFHRCKSHPRIDYRGYGTNKAVRRALQQAHILAYPSIFRETSCLAAIEAGSAGCRIVTTDLGALPETCGGWASYCPYTSDRQTLVNNYTELLRKEIDSYSPTCYNLKMQRAWFNQHYSWQTRIPQWQQLLANLDA